MDVVLHQMSKNKNTQINNIENINDYAYSKINSIQIKNIDNTIFTFKVREKNDLIAPKQKIYDLCNMISCNHVTLDFKVIDRLLIITIIPMIGAA